MDKNSKQKIDYSKSACAPIVTCFVACGGKVLLLKRSKSVLAYQGLWSNLSGFLDDKMGVQAKIREEVQEELGLDPKHIKNIFLGPTYIFEDMSIGRIWNKSVAVAIVDTQDVKLNWEHTSFRWLTPQDLRKYRTTPRLTSDLEAVIGYIETSSSHSSRSTSIEGNGTTTSSSV